MITGNSRILKTEFDYSVPTTLAQALKLIEMYGKDAKVIAGGTDLLVQMKHETVSPVYLINIMHIPEMSFIKKEDGWLKIGAATKWTEIVKFCAQDRDYMALYEASHSLGKTQVRNMGTIGGNLGTASPAADSAPALLVLGCRVELSSVKGERILDIEDFFKGVNVTALAANEIITEIQISPIPKGTGSAFMKMTRVGADISKISCAIALERRGEVCVSCRIALGAVAAVPLRIQNAQKIIVGKSVDFDLVEKMGHMASEETRPITDIRSTAEYRKHAAAVLCQDVFWKAWRRAGGEE